VVSSSTSPVPVTGKSWALITPGALPLAWRRNTLFAVVLALSGASGVDAQTAAPRHAQVELVAENNTLEAGRVAWVGIGFALESGWHIYWVNPGDAGDPPHIEWHLPPGFRAGDIQWPVPVRLPTGPLIDYGYEGQVLLAVPLQVPADYKPGAPSVFAADVRYVICRDVCIPAKANVTLSMPSSAISTTEAAARRAQFREARARWPRPRPAGWEVKASDNGSQLVLSLETGRPEATATFFPLDQDQIDNAAPQVVAPTARGVRLTLHKADPSSKPTAVLKGVVVLAPDRAFEVAVPVTAER
jgi:DsbC/DsbD-like thiol-disulfide interchange protein